MISGQAATPDTRNDCQVFADFVLTGTTLDGQAMGNGCVYPASIKTLPDQLNAVGKTWRAYAEDMGNDATRESAACGHPDLNPVDQTQSLEAPTATVRLGDQYATRHNPFVYFHSIIDSPDCASHVVNLNQLTTDLSSVQATPNFVFITPNLCNDGHDAPCKNGQPGGLVSADAFLQKWIPLIPASKAYQQDGLIIINFDEGPLGSVPTPTAPASWSAPQVDSAVMNSLAPTSRRFRNPLNLLPALRWLSKATAVIALAPFSWRLFSSREPSPTRRTTTTHC
jgi:phosphatidylinositol-3-phosphatase